MKLILSSLFAIAIITGLVFFVDTQYLQITWLIGLHLLVGWVYLALFILFVVDHIAIIKKKLMASKIIYIMGIFFLLFQVVLLFSGIVLYLYDSTQKIELWSRVHYISLIFVIVFGLLHILLRKRKESN